MSELEISLSEEQLEELRAGETVAIATKIREPVRGEIPSSINAIEIQMTTEGLIKTPRTKEAFMNHYAEVDGMEKAWNEYKDNER